VNDDEIERRRRQARLEVVDALLWGAEHAREIVDLTSSALSSDECVARLTSSPYALTEFQAHHVLDIPFRRLAREYVESWEEESAQLRAFEIDGD
jgi:hypothetical protein